MNTELPFMESKFIRDSFPASERGYTWNLPWVMMYKTTRPAKSRTYVVRLNFPCSLLTSLFLKNGKWVFFVTRWHFQSSFALKEYCSNDQVLVGVYSLLGSTKEIICTDKLEVNNTTSSLFLVEQKTMCRKFWWCEINRSINIKAKERGMYKED